MSVAKQEKKKIRSNEFIPNYNENQLRDLKFEINKVFLPRWLEIIDEFNINDIEDFALGLKNLANNYKIPFFVQYTNKFIIDIRSFDIYNIKKDLKNFHVIVKQINDL